MCVKNKPKTCRANQLTGFYMITTLVFNELSYLCKKNMCVQNKLEATFVIRKTYVQNKWDTSFPI